MALTANLLLLPLRPFNRALDFQEDQGGPRRLLANEKVTIPFYLLNFSDIGPCDVQHKFETLLVKSSLSASP